MWRTSTEPNDGRSQPIPQIDSLEASARDVLKLVPSLRNMLQPVNRLPPDILCHVARCVPDKLAKNIKSIVPLTHVCRYWRETIVSTPDIWTLVSSGNESLALLSLQRSKAAPLQIDLHLRTKDRGFIPILLPRIQNIGSLNIHGISSIEELVRVLPGVPRLTPNLQSLTLRGTAFWRAERNQPIDPFVQLTDTLRYLSLDHFPLCPSFLRLRSLTELDIFDYRLNVRLDTFLNLLKDNPSLETVTLSIGFTEASLRSSKPDAVVETQLRYLSIRCIDEADGKALISGIALRRGARLEITHSGTNPTLRGILSGVSPKHLANLPSPTFMECQSYCRSIRLLGPNGVFSFKCLLGPEDPLSELPLPPLSLTNVREFRLLHRRAEQAPSPLKPTVFHPSSFPAIETLAVSCETSVSHLLSNLFSNPAASPSLKTLAFLDCNITEVFVKELELFASNREDTTSARLHRVVIVHPKAKFPSIASIDALGKHVPVVDVRLGKEFPKDLT
jgi:hypothetical protein